MAAAAALELKALAIPVGEAYAAAHPRIPGVSLASEAYW
jgi:hypothetical protein